MGEGEPKRIGLRAGGFSKGKGRGWGWGLRRGQWHPIAQDGQEGGGGCAPLGTEPPQSVPAATMVVPSGSHQPLEGDTGVKLSPSPGRARLLGGWAGGSCGLLARSVAVPHIPPLPLAVHGKQGRSFISKPGGIQWRGIRPSSMWGGRGPPGWHIPTGTLSPSSSWAVSPLAQHGREMVFNISKELTENLLLPGTGPDPASLGRGWDWGHLSPV